MTRGPVGMYVVAPSHLRGARVVATEQLDIGAGTLELVLVLDRTHPVADTRVAVLAEDVVLAPVPPAALGYDEVVAVA